MYLARRGHLRQPTGDPERVQRLDTIRFDSIQAPDSSARPIAVKNGFRRRHTFVDVVGASCRAARARRPEHSSPSAGRCPRPLARSAPVRATGDGRRETGERRRITFACPPHVSSGGRHPRRRLSRPAHLYLAM